MAHSTFLEAAHGPASLAAFPAPLDPLLPTDGARVQGALTAPSSPLSAPSDPLPPETARGAEPAPIDGTAPAPPASPPPVPPVQAVTGTHTLQSQEPAPAAPAQSVTTTPVSDGQSLPQVLGLEARQRRALEALAAGHGSVAAARMAGVDRTTLYRWSKTNPSFIAALNAWRHHTRDVVSDQLLGATEDAAKVVIEAVRNGDVKAALTLLKAMGSLASARIGPRTALAVHRQQDLAEARAEAVSLRKRLLCNMDLSSLASHPIVEYLNKVDENFAKEQAELEKSCEQAGGTEDQP